MNKKPIIDILKSISLFSSFSDEECGRLFPLLRKQIFAAGDMIIFQGDDGDTMYVIASGMVEVWRNDEHDGKVELGILSDGQFFGELAIIDSLPRSATVEAVRETEAYVLTKGDFDDLLKRDIVLANKFYSSCISETFMRFRNIVANFTFSQYNLKTKTAALDELNRDLQYAKKMQRYFLDTDFLDSSSELPGRIRHSYLYRPCIDIGGDFLNVHLVDADRIAVIIADVSGHGITAALATGVIKSGLSVYSAQYSDDPAMMVSKLNSHLCELIDGNFATCVYALIDTRRHKITCAKAGHPYPLLWKNGRMASMGTDLRGAALGIVPDCVYTQSEVDYAPGDKILFFTDGIVEQQGKGGGMYGDDRLRSVFASLIESESPRILDGIFADMTSYSGAQVYDDDVTMLLLELNG